MFACFLLFLNHLVVGENRFLPNQFNNESVHTNGEISHLNSPFRNERNALGLICGGVFCFQVREIPKSPACTSTTLTAWMMTTSTTGTWPCLRSQITLHHSVSISDSLFLDLIRFPSPPNRPSRHRRRWTLGRRCRLCSVAWPTTPTSRRGPKNTRRPRALARRRNQARFRSHNKNNNSIIVKLAGQTTPPPLPPQKTKKQTS